MACSSSPRWLGFLLLVQGVSSLHTYSKHLPFGRMDVTSFDAQSDMVVATPHRSRIPLVRPQDAINFRIKREELDYAVRHELSRTEPQHTAKAEGGYIAFVVAALSILVGAFILFVLYSHTHQAITRYTGIGIQHVCCLVFMFLSVSTDLSTKAATKKQGGHYAFDPATAVVIVEACKLVISIGLFLGSLARRKKDDSPLELPTLGDTMLLTVPGLVYTCNNILVFEAIERVPLATFAVIRETRMIWNALIWISLFGVPLGIGRWSAILGVIIGCTANQVPGAVRDGFSWGVMYAFLLAFLNAAGGVVCEFAMKRKASMDINLQNSIIYASCSSLAVVYLGIFRPANFASPGAFFHGFEPECLQIIVLQIITGLTVSRILKHVESVTKSMVAAMCSPIICFLGSAAMHVTLHWNDIFAALLVAFSCLFYLKQGPLGGASAAAPAKDKAQTLAAKVVS